MVSPESWLQSPHMSRSHFAGMPPVLLCSHCGAMHGPRAAPEPGVNVLLRLARVGLYPGAPPVLNPERGGD